MFVLISISNIFRFYFSLVLLLLVYYGRSLRFFFSRVKEQTDISKKKKNKREIEWEWESTIDKPNRMANDLTNFPELKKKKTTSKLCTSKKKKNDKTKWVWTMLRPFRDWIFTNFAYKLCCAVLQTHMHTRKLLFQSPKTCKRAEPVVREWRV